MRNVGIVCEFDPYHNGHRYLTDTVRERGARSVICVLSGDFTQRGDVAAFDKQLRAKCAVKHGADLVIELPPPFSCACSEVFAKAAVKLLAAAGADTLSFGTEISDIGLLKEAAEISESIKTDKRTTEFTALGLSYPAAVSRCIELYYGGQYSRVFSSPNATLAVEYIKAAKEHGIEDFLPIKRKGASHNGEPVGNIACASYIRQLLREKRDASRFTPFDLDSQTPAFIENMGRHIVYSVCNATPEMLRACPDCTINLADRIIKLSREKPVNLEDMLSMLKGRDITLARLRRVVLFIAAGLEDMQLSELNAARVLAFNKKGAELLKKAKDSGVALTPSLAKAAELCPKAARNTERASYFRHLCTAQDTPAPNEYTRRIIIEREF